MNSAQVHLHVSHAQFTLGVNGIHTRRNTIALLLAIELILNASALNFVLFSRLFSHVQGQAFVLFIIALAACEVVVGLAIVIGLWRHARTVCADDVELLKG